MNMRDAARESDYKMALLKDGEGNSHIFDSDSQTFIHYTHGEMRSHPDHVQPNPGCSHWEPLKSPLVARRAKHYLQNGKTAPAPESHEYPVHSMKYYAVDFEEIEDGKGRGTYQTVMVGTSHDPREFLVRSLYSREEFVGLGGLRLRQLTKEEYELSKEENFHERRKPLVSMAMLAKMFGR